MSTLKNRDGYRVTYAMDGTNASVLDGTTARVLDYPIKKQRRRLHMFILFMLLIFDTEVNNAKFY